MHEEIIIAGFGGQGILFSGKLLCQAGMDIGLNVTYLPSYGAEVRGGTAHCHVVLSNESIASPVVPSPTILLIMNEPSLMKFESRLISSGLLVFNSSLISSQPIRTDTEIVSIPATDMANDIGNVKVANMIMLGVCLAHKEVLPKESIIKSLPVLLSPRSFVKGRGLSGKKSLADINVKAIELGYNYSAK